MERIIDFVTCERLEAVEGLRVVRPGGAMYVMVGIDVDRLEGINSDVDFAQELLTEECVFVIPGSCFRMNNFFRVVFSAPTEKLEEAYDRIGGDHILGYDVRSARRSMNIMFSDWANRGYNQWTVEYKTLAITTGTIEYTLPGTCSSKSLHQAFEESFSWAFQNIVSNQSACRGATGSNKAGCLTLELYC